MTSHTRLPKISFCLGVLGAASGIVAGCKDPRPGRLFIPSRPVCEDTVGRPPAARVESALSARVEWERTDFQPDPGSNRVNFPALVVPLRDTNGDGRRDGRDVPAVVISTQKDKFQDNDGHVFLRALDGATGETIWTSDGPQEGVAVMPGAGDLDRDGRIDLVWSPSFEVPMMVLDDAGHETARYDDRFPTLGWCQFSNVLEYLGPLANSVTLSDMDHDGYPEILAGNRWLDHDLSVISYGVYGCGSGSSLAADILGDAEEEILGGAMVYSMAGEELLVEPQFYWEVPTTDGSPAVLDLDGDGDPEFLAVSGGVYAFDAPGEMRFRDESIGGGGPPAVADFDGDGRPEIAVANSFEVMMLDDDGSEIWRRRHLRDPAASPGTSRQVAAVAFDFDGDGFPEVILQNENRVMVLSGRDGSVRLEYPVRSYEMRLLMPVVADVDGDGEAELVVTAKGSLDGPEPRGVRVLGSAGKPWPPARRIWNQVNYFRDNVNDDGSIPRVAGKPWLTHNTFRSADLVTGQELWSSVDLVVRAGDACLARCEGGRLKVQATVGNQGYVASTQGAKVALYATVTLPSGEDDRDGGGSPDGRAAAPASATRDVELATWTVDETIEPGQRTPVHTFQVPLQALSEALDGGDLLALHATVTASAQDAEYHTENNDTAWGLAPCELP